MTIKKSKSVVPIGKIKNALRRIHMHCKYRSKAKQLCKVDKATYACQECNLYLYEGASEKNFLGLVETHVGEFEVIRGKIEMDHKIPVVQPKSGFANFDDYIHSLWVDENGYTGLCSECHAKKTSEENKERVKHGTLKRKGKDV
jgi:5-methylcytosine-specific restriction endonuclease McrA